MSVKDGQDGKLTSDIDRPFGGVIAVPYSGLSLDRATEQRADPAWVAGLAADRRSRVLPLWRDRCMVTGSPPTPIMLPAAVFEGTDASPLVFLGSENRVPYFAIDLSDIDLEDALASTGADAAVDVRALFTDLPPAQAGVLAYARGLLYWNRHQRYCGRCGFAAEPRNGGHLRVCTNRECRRQLFPRIEPAIITLVETSTSPSRCLLARHRNSKTGGYSLLAGFVEVGESLEDAVRREMFEEAGVRVSDVVYVGSQPWSFPAALMVGFRATAASESLSVDGDEITDARWFTRDELQEYGEATGHLGRPDSIDRVILTTWLTEGGARGSWCHEGEPG